MILLLDWMDRTWSFDLPLGAFPVVLERLRGTAPCARELFRGVPNSTLRTRPDNHWSAIEHLGHLDDLHELDTRRLEAFLARAETLPAADPTNQRTDTAGHGATPVSELLERFGRRRLELVHRMEALSAEEIAIASIHPRLKRSMRLIDWAQFVADHDDHHLVHAREAIRSVGGPV